MVLAFRPTLSDTTLHHSTAQHTLTSRPPFFVLFGILSSHTHTFNTIQRMHPLVRDLYKRALMVGRDYPQGLDYVRTAWKKALRNQQNCPSCYGTAASSSSSLRHDNFYYSPACEREIRRAVGKGRKYIQEMVGVIQLKKYRTLRKRYDLEQQHQQQQQQSTPTTNASSSSSSSAVEPPSIR